MKIFTFSILFLAGFITVSAQNTPFLTVQYAGSTGYISIGGGITSRSHKIQNELLYGFVPKAYGGPLDKVTYRFTYLPFHLQLNKRVSWMPVNPVAFAAYNIGKDYSAQPSYKKYDADYYWWSPAFRVHAGFNTALQINHKNSNNKTLLYLEANTNDRYITTWWDNTSNLNISEIFFLGFGMKILVN